MALKRKRKNNIDVYGQIVNKPGSILDNRQELLDKITKSDSFLPDSILHDDLDKGMLNYVSEHFVVDSDGYKIPVIPKILTIQRWGEFTNNWEFSDDDGNITVPFISVVRKPDVQPGTNLSTHKTIPDRKNYYYAKIPTWDGNQMGADIYKIPQPVAVDITYEISIVCNKFRDLNRLNKIVMQKFASRQSYTVVKGHYIPIILNSVSDSSPLSSIDNRRFYLQTYNFTLLGLLNDKEEFEVKPALSRALLTMEILNERDVTKVPINIELGFFSINLVSDGIQTLYTLNDKMNEIIAVTINGLVQRKDEHYYYISGTNRVTFINPPLVGSVIEFIYYKGKFGTLVYNDDVLEIVNVVHTYDGDNNIPFLNNIFDVILLDANGLVLEKNTDFIVTTNNIQLIHQPVIGTKINITLVYNLGNIGTFSSINYELLSEFEHEMFVYDGTSLTFLLTNPIKDVITVEYNGLLQLKNNYYDIDSVNNTITLKFTPVLNTEIGVIYST